MKVPTNLLRDSIKYYVGQLLSLYGEPEARQLIYMLSEHYFGMDRLKHSLNPDFRLTETELLKLHFAVKELLQHKPIQYITGKAWFNGHWFAVDPSVLIPRPETEEMTLKAIEVLRPLSGAPRVLDIGTGSGCIAITIKLALPQAEVLAFDIDEKALTTAKENAKSLNANIQFMQSDVNQAAVRFLKNSLDMIISNPPYVTHKEKKLMKRNVLDWEPGLALFVPDEDPLMFYRSIAVLAKTCLKASGRLMLEINELYSDSVSALLEEKGFERIELLEDIHGKIRIVEASKTR